MLYLRHEYLFFITKVKKYYGESGIKVFYCFSIVILLQVAFFQFILL
ncbi:hypothetical protein NSE_0089 [Neorickettsia sennetsu str. Miyayama]|uniref:Uncharacterized protein n=1 Tax=Ehrlichia sennetsu (strain ATCC VR-367 / Miyayama) TaxID=222891 RepID=Q2GEV6_EHRS3|nr:hypothetical protein NSE_0089 [Neorickettsia sennetsu str. Miyayama]